MLLMQRLGTHTFANQHLHDVVQHNVLRIITNLHVAGGVPRAPVPFHDLGARLQLSDLLDEVFDGRSLVTVLDRSLLHMVEKEVFETLDNHESHDLASVTISDDHPGCLPFGHRRHRLMLDVCLQHAFRHGILVRLLHDVPKPSIRPLLGFAELVMEVPLGPILGSGLGPDSFLLVLLNGREGNADQAAPFYLGHCVGHRLLRQSFMNLRVDVCAGLRVDIGFF